MQDRLTHRTASAQVPGDHQVRIQSHQTERDNALAW